MIFQKTYIYIYIYIYIYRFTYSYTDAIFVFFIFKCINAAKHCFIPLNIEKLCFREKNTLDGFDFKNGHGFFR